MFSRISRAVKSAYRELRGSALDLDDFGFPIDHISTFTGVYITENKALSIPTVYVCLKILAETIAQLPRHLYRRDGTDTRSKALDHPLYRVIHNASNPQVTAYRFFQMMTGNTAWKGNAYAEIVRDMQGRVVQLVPWSPGIVKAETDGADIKYSVKLKNGDYLKVPSDRVLHLRGLALDTNALIGISPIHQIRELFGEAVAAQIYNSKFFKQGGVPPFVLESDGTRNLTEEQKKDLRESLEQLYSGVTGAHKWPILYGGLKANPIGLKPEDMQLIQSVQYIRTQIASIWRIPPHMAGDLSRATFSNIEQQSLEFLLYTLMPWIVNFEQELELALLNEYERDQYQIRFTVDGLLRGDNRSRTEAYAKLINWGIISPNEARALENMNPRDGGDVYLTPVNMQDGVSQANNGNGNESSGVRNRLLWIADHLEDQELASIIKQNGNGNGNGSMNHAADDN